MINDLPTIFEVVTGSVKKQVKEKSAVSNHSGNKSKSNSKTVKGLSVYNPFIWLRKLQYVCGQWPLCCSGFLEGRSTELCILHWKPVLVTMFCFLANNCSHW